jgi:hypothetical protein
MMPDCAPATQAPTPQVLRRLAKRQDRKRIAAQQRQERARARKAAEEARAEQLAPKVQRLTVYARDGVTVLRGPRVELSGITMVRSNPIKRLAARSRRKEYPTIGEAHVIAADRLLTAWEECHGSPCQCANYSERQSGRASPGAISDATLEAADDFVRARDEVLRIEARLGALWPVIHAVVICAIDPSAWGEAQGMNGNMSVGYVTAALDLLVRCYQPREPIRGQIRAIEFITRDLSQWKDSLTVSKIARKSILSMSYGKA